MSYNSYGNFHAALWRCHNLHAVGAKGLKITSLFYLALGMIYVVRGVLNGIGDAFFALFNGIVEVIGRFTIPLILTQYLGMGAIGIWVASGVVWFLSGSTAWLRLFTHFTLKNRVKHDDDSFVKQ